MDGFRLEWEEQEERRKWKKQKELITRRYDHLAIGTRFKGCTFDNYYPADEAAAKVKKICQRYAETFGDRRKSGDSLILTGSPGTGKNHLSAAICKAVINANMTALHMTALKLVREIKETWRKGSERSEKEMIDFFLAPDLLAIDEIGAQFGSQAEQVLLMEVINSRYADLRPTILLSNLPVAELENQLGAQVVDRFYEGRSSVLVMEWPSYRRR